MHFDPDSVRMTRIGSPFAGRAMAARAFRRAFRSGAVSAPRHVAIIFSVSAARIRETSHPGPLGRGLGGGAK